MGSRARSAHSARVIDESDDHKNHSPDPDAAAAAAAAAPLAGKLDQWRWYARNPPVRVSYETTRLRERAFPPGAPFSPDADRPLIRRSLIKLLVAVVVVVFVVVVPFRRDARSRIASFANPGAMRDVTRTTSHAYRPADLPVDTVQFNAVILRAHCTLFHSFFFSHVSVYSLARIHHKHLAPPVRNARANLTLGGPNALL